MGQWQVNDKMNRNPHPVTVLYEDLVEHHWACHVFWGRVSWIPSFPIFFQSVKLSDYLWLANLGRNKYCRSDLLKW